ncbi:hypothetical protein GE061_005061 [Apolygus lucorum]|uniref:Amino acid permease/ SLC12A domain-containing protein n=1 Tax=Apolygus lucorum TaxID=248454 RepID=A0A8S9WWY0_APOLU|nr:hypothetical protein GE061_005061 [Apolygus lucorum]
MLTAERSVAGTLQELNFFRPTYPCYFTLDKITKQKLVITREVATESRVYSKRDMVIFSVSCSLGVNLWQSATILNLYGDVGCYSLMVCGMLHLISFMCYLELTSMQPCLGGAYHYAYNTYGQLIAFLVGWMMLGYFMASKSSS